MRLTSRTASPSTSAGRRQPIPQPKPLPLIGNLRELDIEHGALALADLGKELGPIFQLVLPPGPVVVLTGQRLVDEVCDEVRLDKRVHLPLLHLRDIVGDGLFTAVSKEPNWGKAHRILMPAFGPAALSAMFDTIALCSFGYRFNSLYSDDLHPFVQAMVRSLDQTGQRAQRLPLQNRLRLRAARQFAQDRDLMWDLADRLITDRRRHPLPDGHTDLLDTMLQASDPLTGERLSDENVRYQLVTFLVAGHETTSGLLSFAFYELLRNPDVLARAQAQVDQVIGDRAPEYADLTRLTYLDQVLKETLRLWPTAPAFGVCPREDTLLDDRFAVAKGTTILVIAPGLHRDPTVWEAPERFDPERWTFERARELPPNAYKPFGNGQRSCIGRGFALQESVLFLAMFLQRFDLRSGDADYTLSIAHTLTMKPRDLRVRGSRRHGRTRWSGASRARASFAASPTSLAQPSDNEVPLQVLYGSNAGTAEGFARRLAAEAIDRGYRATVDTLDSVTGSLAQAGAVLIVTSSYEGKGPDNARAFLDWLRELPDGTLGGVDHAVFGCSNSLPRRDRCGRGRGRGLARPDAAARPLPHRRVRLLLVGTSARRTRSPSSALEPWSHS